MIKSFEGFRPRAIQRADGRWTIGYGHTASAREGLTVSESDAELLLQYDLIPVVKALEAVRAPLNQHQYDALASFAFSVGVERFNVSDVLRRLDAGETDAAAEALAAWEDDGALMAPPRRRAAERALFVAAPDAPVSLADLLAAPLPAPAATVIETTAQGADVADFDPDEAAPFPTIDVAQPLTREAAVAALLGESESQSPEDAEEPLALETAAAAAEPEDLAIDAPSTVSAEAVQSAPGEEQATTSPAVNAPAQDEADSEPQGEPRSEAGPAPTPRPTVSLAAFYSPYAVRATGPLSLVTRPPVAAAPAAVEPAFQPASPQDRAAATPSAPLPPIPASETEPEDLPAANDDGLTQETTEVAATEAAMAPDVIEEEAAVQVPMFSTLSLQHDSPFTLSDADSAPAPLASEPAALAGGFTFETDQIDPVDQRGLFEAEPPLDQGLQPGDGPLAPAQRFGWSETATFLLMGGIGMLAFGASMAAFRQAAESQGADTALVGWVLALIALACVGVSGFNLYQRWGRVERQ